VWPVFAVLAVFALRVLVFVPEADHVLDSDLAVDGLAIQQLALGEWLWHFPGTPSLGIPHAFPALLWAWRGVDAATLQLGGATTTLLLAVAVYFLARRFSNGPSRGLPALVPLVFANAGVLWLSARLTGGHLLTAAWFAWSWALALRSLEPNRLLTHVGSGLVLALGLWLDPLALLGILGILPTIVVAGWNPSRWLRCLRAAFLWLAGFAIGLAPSWISRDEDPYDAYSPVSANSRLGQAQTILSASTGPRGFDWGYGIDWRKVGTLAREHARILGLECLPRLFLGRKLPSLQFDPPAEALVGRAGSSRPASPIDTLAVLAVVASGLTSVASFLAIVLFRGSARSGLALAGMLVTAGASLLMFILHLDIYNSDNFRYLVFLIVPWCVGFEILCSWVGHRVKPTASLVFTAIAIGGLIMLPFLDTIRWARDYLPSVDRAAVAADAKLFDVLQDQPEIRSVYGNYWDVYRLAFRSQGRLVGIPYPAYPKRFPLRELEAYKSPGRFLLARKTDRFGVYYRNQALAQGARLLLETDDAWVYDWPTEPRVEAR
jgi:hypothetical protein